MTGPFWWKSLDERIRGAGGKPGDYNFAADILDMAAHEADLWMKDAMQIPDVLGEAARFLRACATPEEDDSE